VKDLLAPLVVQRRFRVPEGGKKHQNVGGRGGTSSQLIFNDSRVSGKSIPGYDVMDKHISVFPNQDQTADDFHVTFELLPNNNAPGSAVAVRTKYEKDKAEVDPQANWRGGPKAPSALGKISVHFWFTENGCLRNDLYSKLAMSMSKKDFDEAKRILSVGANQIGKAFAQSLTKVEGANVGAASGPP
jgi:hypothetical protein